jgi:hypothetical protein
MSDTVTITLDREEAETVGKELGLGSAVTDHGYSAFRSASVKLRVALNTPAPEQSQASSGLSDEEQAVKVLTRFMCCCKAGEEYVEEKLLRPFGFTLDAGPVVRENSVLREDAHYVEVLLREMVKNIDEGDDDLLRFRRRIFGTAQYLKSKLADQTPSEDKTGDQGLTIDAEEFEEARRDPRTKELLRRADEYAERLPDKTGAGDSLLTKEQRRAVIRDAAAKVAADRTGFLSHAQGTAGDERATAEKVLGALLIDDGKWLAKCADNAAIVKWLRGAIQAALQGRPLPLLTTGEIERAFTTDAATEAALAAADISSADLGNVRRALLDAAFGDTQPEPCKRCNGTRRLVASRSGGLPATYDCPDCTQPLSTPETEDVDHD